MVLGVSTVPPKAVTRENKCREFVESIVFNSDTPTLLGNIGGEARMIHSLASEGIPKLKKFTRALSTTRFVSIINAPFNVYEVITGTANLIMDKGKEKRIDNGLDLISNIGQLGEDIGVVAEAINDLKPIAHIAYLTTPLTIISVAFSVVTYIIQGKSIYWCKKIIKKLETKPLDKVFKKHHYHIERQCEIDPKIIKKAIKVNNKEAVVKELKKRIHAKIACHALTIAITTIGIIASIIFLSMTASPLLIAGSALMATLFLLGIVKKGVDYFSNRRLHRSISKLA